MVGRHSTIAGTWGQSKYMQELSTSHLSSIQLIEIFNSIRISRFWFVLIAI